MAQKACKKCKTIYLVGIGNKDIRNKGSGGDNFIGFGNSEISEAKELNRKNKLPCAKCRELCKIQDSKANDRL